MPDRLPISPKVMGRSILDAEFSQIVEATAKKIENLGLHQRGSMLRVVRQSNAEFIEFQEGTKSSNDKILFTMNPAVIC